MSRTILSVAYPLAPVGDDAVGGAEQVLTMIERGIVRGGHRSIVVAAEGSRCEGELVATPRVDGVLGHGPGRTSATELQSRGCSRRLESI